MKGFKGFSEEMMTTGDAGIPQDTSNMKPRGKKRSAITRRYLEVNGVRKLRVKESQQQEACWDSHKRVGTKKKDGKTVPNCVPKNESVEQVDEISQGLRNRYLSKAQDDIQDRRTKRFKLATEPVGDSLPKKRTPAEKEKSMRDARKRPNRYAGIRRATRMGEDVEQVDEARRKKMKIAGRDVVVVPVSGSKSEFYYEWKRKDGKKGYGEYDLDFDKSPMQLMAKEIKAQDKKDGTGSYGRHFESVEHTNEARFSGAGSGDDTLTKDQLPRNVAAVVKKVFKVIKKHKKPGKVSVHKLPKGKYTVFIAVGRDDGREDEYEEYTGDLISIIPWEKRKTSKIEIDIAASMYPAPKNIIREDVEQVDELSKRGVKRYIRKSRNDKTDAELGADANAYYGDDYGASIEDDRANKRRRGIDMARSKINKTGKAKVRATESVENLEEKTFKANLSDKDYQKIRSASMRGNFTHKFSRKTNGDVTFNTKNPVTLSKDLEKLIDSGASSWSDILDIHGV